MRLRTVFKVSAGVLLTLGVFTFGALRVDTTGTYEHSFNAPAGRLWQVWTEPASIKKWWGPTGYTAPMVRNDARVGGTYLWSMMSPDGDVVWNTGVYTEIVPNTRIVSTMAFSDAAGRAIPGAQVPVPGHWPDEIRVMTEFSESGGATKVRVTEVGIPFFVALLSKIAWSQQFDKVQRLL